MSPQLIKVWGSSQVMGAEFAIADWGIGLLMAMKSCYVHGGEFNYSYPYTVEDLYLVHLKVVSSH